VTFRGAEAPAFGQGPRSAALDRSQLPPGEIRRLFALGLEQPMGRQLSAGVQRQFGDRLGLALDGVLVDTRNLPRSWDLNASTRGIGPADTVSLPVTAGDAFRPVRPVAGGYRRRTTSESGGRSRYAALQTALRWDAARAWTLDANWVWSRARNDTEDINFNATQGNRFDLEWADAVNDRRHKATTRLTWTGLPRTDARRDRRLPDGHADQPRRLLPRPRRLGRHLRQRLPRQPGPLLRRAAQRRAAAERVPDARERGVRRADRWGARARRGSCAPTCSTCSTRPSRRATPTASRRRARHAGGAPGDRSCSRRGGAAAGAAVGPVCVLSAARTAGRVRTCGCGPTAASGPRARCWRCCSLGLACGGGRARVTVGGDAARGALPWDSCARGRAARGGVAHVARRSVDQRVRRPVGGAAPARPPRRDAARHRGHGPELVNQLVVEREAGRAGAGVASLVWINGETFANLRRERLLAGPWAGRLPNARTSTRASPIVARDFEQDPAGYESPWGRVQFALIWDTLRTPRPPATVVELGAWIRAHPGRFTHDQGSPASPSSRG
jgi:hypothetical protein